MSTILPDPTDIRVDEDGALHLTWCFGDQGQPNSWRVFCLWQPGEGMYASKLVHTPPSAVQVEGDAVGPALAEWLENATESSGSEEDKDG